MNLKSANNVNAPLKPPTPLCRSGCYFHTRDLARSWRARGRLPFFGFKCAGREKMRARRQQAERHETVHVGHGARTDLQPCAGPRVVAEVARQHQTLRNKLQPAARCGTLLVNIGAWLRYRLYRRIRSSLIASGEAYIVDRVVDRIADGILRLVRILNPLADLPSRKRRHRIQKITQATLRRGRLGGPFEGPRLSKH